MEKLILLVLALEEDCLEAIVVQIQTAHGGEASSQAAHHSACREEYLWKLDSELLKWIFLTWMSPF
jgi:hypothetical protein